MLLSFLLIILINSQLPEWNFDNESILQKWVSNGQIVNVKIEESRLCGKTQGTDPFFLCEGLEIPASPYQYIHIVIKASCGGRAQLFWTGTTEGPYGGLSDKKSTFFNIEEKNDWQDIYVFPFWHKEGVIRKMRLDLYDNLEFEIKSISIKSWDNGVAPLTNIYDWQFPDGDISVWKIADNNNRYYFAKPISLSIGKKEYLTLEYSALGEANLINLIWSFQNSAGPETCSIPIQNDGKKHIVALNMTEYSAWKETIVGLGFQVPEKSNLKIYSIHIGEEPIAQSELTVEYFGAEQGANRASRDFPVLLRLANRGGGIAYIDKVDFICPDNLKIEKGPAPEPPYEIGYDDFFDVYWTVSAQEAGRYPIKIVASTKGNNIVENTGELQVLPDIKITESDYVPEPKPIKTQLDICAFYFPGWDTPERWDCIQTVAPIRKPILGYYDEGNPECVDWQIKWAVENGITCFFVDWYWIAGNQTLTHWFEAYRSARYRDMLKVAIMWANHNPPKTHSAEDWEKVNKEWIDNYFSLPSYYRINNKPLVCIWSPLNLRSDLGSSDAVKELLTRSQDWAKAASYDGIEFMAINHNQTATELQVLKAEGYTCFTNYHEFNKAVYMSKIPNYARYEDVVSTIPAIWEEKNSLCEGMTYYPLVETGWDSRPWHGSKALVIEGRTPELFKTMLSSSNDFAKKYNKPIIVLGPVNEWGEGSYIEPNTEFGFAMYEAIRDVFTESNSQPLPTNIAPADVGLGPYDFPMPEFQTSWDFHEDLAGWKIFAGMDSLKVIDGSLTGRVNSGDPSIYFYFYKTKGLKAIQYPRATLRLRVDGAPSPDSKAQLYWSKNGLNFNEDNSATIPIRIDGGYYTYTFTLRENPNWTGRIKTIRIDPCNLNNVTIWIDSFTLHQN
ncbi:MAG TPA: glycoside hydrolase family 99-like domain-containing protein [Candidatus Hydrogenedens sp.]|nr:glycoside hydrolase family 99-like domain-containing protein [Candidatus Hydrogenedens sp.]